MLKQYLKENVLITDGAMGTYFSQISGKESSFAELANKSNGKMIENIHREYIESGANLIRTNSFSLNTRTMGISRDEVRELIICSFENAKKALDNKDIFIGASIGPIPCCDDFSTADTLRLDEYKYIVDTFLGEGADIFIFETFSDTECLDEISKYIKEKSPNSFILTQFAVSPDGKTRRGISMEQLIDSCSKYSNVDAYGFNCGVGPSHLSSLLKKVKLGDKPLSVLPNAGFPQLINERMVFAENPQYFARIMRNIKDMGANIIGGCCGTTPLHIKCISKALNQLDGKEIELAEIKIKNMKLENQKVQWSKNAFNLPIAVELGAPPDSNADKFIKGAKILKEKGVDFVTIPDSPLGRVRADSITLAAKAKREAGIEAIPHICCRDRNVLSLQSALLGGNIEGLRNALIVTGDPVPHAARNEVSSVFNLNSIRLIRMLNEMNNTVFTQNPYSIYAALNLNVVNKEAELRRMKQKYDEAKVTFFTQPIFDDEAIDFLNEVKKSMDVKVFAGIIPLVSYRNALFLNNEMPGMRIPEKYISRFDDTMAREVAENIGIDIAIDIVDRIKGTCDGLYFITPFYRVQMICNIVDRLRSADVNLLQEE